MSNQVLTIKPLEAPGKPSGRLSGGWVADHAALQKFLTFCDHCDSKFNPKKSNYESWRRSLYPYVMARCTGCHGWLPCKAFNHEAEHDAVGDWMPSRRRRGRWASPR